MLLKNSVTCLQRESGVNHGDVGQFRTLEVSKEVTPVAKAWGVLRMFSIGRSFHLWKVGKLV